MNRFQPLDVSNASIGVHLYPSEEVLLLTEGVGLYSGPSKSLPHSSGTVYLTNHRIFYVDDAQPHRHSCYLPLSVVRETQYYAGFLKSSAKVTLGFRPLDEEEDDEAPLARPRSADERRGEASGTSNGRSSTSSTPKSGIHQAAQAVPASTSYSSSRPNIAVPNGDWRVDARPQDAGSSALPKTSWVCRVCAFSNALDAGVSKDATVKCCLCGVPTPLKNVALDVRPAQQSAASTSLSSSIANETTSQTVTSPKAGVTCPACTFSNHPSMLRCEMCETALGTFNVEQEMTRQQEASQGANLSRRASSKSEGASPAEEQHNSVRLSFRKGGDKAFYEMLKPTLKQKRWLQSSSASTSSLSVRQSTTFESRHANIDGRVSQKSGSTRRVGIEGIMSAVDLQSREESSDMQDALRDLEALMTRAKKMVDFAEALNAKLAKQEAAKAENIPQSGETSGNGVLADPDEAATMIRSSLVRLGLPTPAITADMARDEYEYNVELARELGGLLYAPKAPIIGRGNVLRTIRPLPEPDVLPDASSMGQISARDGEGILPLDEAWCIWNRARGVALVSPKELLAVAPLLPRLTQPSIECKTFMSGLKVLHTPRFADHVLSQRVCAHLHDAEQAQKADEGDMDLYATLRAGPSVKDYSLTNGLSTLELARLESCPLHLMDELLAHVEQRLGSIVRDEHGGTTMWFLNHFSLS